MSRLEKVDDEEYRFKKRSGDGEMVEEVDANAFGFNGRR